MRVSTYEIFIYLPQIFQSKIENQTNKKWKNCRFFHLKMIHLFKKCCMSHHYTVFFATSGVTFLITSSTIKYDVIIHPRVLFSKCVLMKNQNRNETFFYYELMMTSHSWSVSIGRNTSMGRIFREINSPRLVTVTVFPPIEISLPPLIILKKTMN